ncbi:hypothetical protein ILYODFUR_013507, partial [Ilyodon furcidens]
FDLCSVFTCEGSELAWTKYNVYLSIYQKGAVDGMENIGMPAQDFVIWDTKQGRILSDNPYAETFQHLVTLARGQAKGKLTTGGINPILLSIGRIQSNPYQNPNITIRPPTLRCGNMSSGFICI